MDRTTLRCPGERRTPEGELDPDPDRSANDGYGADPLVLVARTVGPAEHIVVQDESVPAIPAGAVHPMAQAAWGSPAMERSCDPPGMRPGKASVWPARLGGRSLTGVRRRCAGP